jgi:uncharacterized protein (DUF433 family)
MVPNSTGRTCRFVLLPTDFCPSRGASGYTHTMDRIVIDPAVCNGRPIIKGTRIAVQTILEALGAGDSVDNVLAAYPSVEHADILAAFQYSSRLLANHYSITLVA